MSYPLFDGSISASPEEKLKQAFEEWVAWRARSRSRARMFKPLSTESAEVYREMWNAFAPYCAERGLELHELSEADLQNFLRTRAMSSCTGDHLASSQPANLTPRYARRFLSLIDWVSSYHAREEVAPANHAAKRLLDRPEYKYANAAAKDPLPEYLSNVEANRLIAYVTQFADRSSEAHNWKEVRDQTAVAMMLGGGLTPGDVRTLRLSGVLFADGPMSGVPWKLSLPGNGNFPARETPLADWAGRQLTFWLAARSEQNIAGDFVFPSTLTGKQWSDTRCFLSCRDVLTAASVSNDAGGMFKLRHTFALRQLAHGHSETEVAQWLGLLDINGMLRYRRILTSPVDLV